MTDPQRSTEQNPTNPKAISTPAGSTLSKERERQLILACSSRKTRTKALATGPSADTKRTASSAGENQPASLGPGQGWNPSFGATRGDKGIRAVPANTRWKGNVKLSLGATGLCSDPLATDDRLSFKGTVPPLSFKGGRGSPGLSGVSGATPMATGEARLFLCRDTAAAQGGRQACVPALMPGLCQIRSRQGLLPGPLPVLPKLS